MTEAQEILELLRKAPTGDRQLDGRIFVLLNPDTECVLFIKSGMEITRVVVDEHVPRYTASIDAALELVGEQEGGNKAGFLQAAMFQRCIGDIPDGRLALAVCERALERAMAMGRLAA